MRDAEDIMKRWIAPLLLLFLAVPAWAASDEAKPKLRVIYYYLPG